MNGELRIALVMLIVLSSGFAGCLDDNGEDEDLDHRQLMRDLVISMGDHARGEDPDFIVIPQNGIELLSMDPERAADPAIDYMDAIDGVGQEDLLYGYDEDDRRTPSEETEWLRNFLDLGEDNGVEALVTDYCWSRDKMDRSYEENEKKGYISFAADHRDLDNIPDYPDDPHNLNENDVTTLSDARNFLYLIDPSGYETRIEYLDSLRDTNYDLLIIDAFFEDQEILTEEEVNSLKLKQNGGTRLVISYMSIGEAEDYRYYWEDDWKQGDPGFIDEENPDWEGNYIVRYWDEEWQNVIFGEGDSYTDRLLSSGFDGVYLDIIEAFEYYE